MTRPRTAARGYTMIEVMISLAVLAIGASGVMAMQRVTLIANSNARNVAMANQIAATWAERLRADAIQWNNPTSGPDLADTRWLKQVTISPSQWFAPTSTVVDGAGTAWANINGDDLYGVTRAAYCTHVRLTQLYPSLIRAEIRVFWARNESSIACSEADPTLVNSSYDKYGFVYVTTGILNNVIPDFTP